MKGSDGILLLSNAAFFMEKIKAIAGAASVEVNKEYVLCTSKNFMLMGMLHITLIGMGRKDCHIVVHLLKQALLLTHFILVINLK